MKRLILRRSAALSLGAFGLVGVFSWLALGCSSPLRLVIGKVRMDKLGVLYCSVSPDGWARQGFPHITATVEADCDSEGDLDVNVLTPSESKVGGKVTARLQAGESSSFSTPAFPQPKSKHAEVMVRVGAVCGGKYRSTVSSCTMPW